MDQAEFAACVDGYNKRAEDQMQAYAWIVANIMNSMPNFSKSRRQPVTPGQLLGKSKQTEKPTSAEHFKKIMRERSK